MALTLTAELRYGLTHLSKALETSGKEGEARAQAYPEHLELGCEPQLP